MSGDVGPGDVGPGDVGPGDVGPDRSGWLHAGDGGSPGGVVVRRVPARAGLVGNPSDGFGGAVLATPVPSLAATVRAAAAPGVRIGDDDAAPEWPTLHEWLEHVARSGHGDQRRLLSASLWVLVDHVGRRSGSLVSLGGVVLDWSSAIPRSVGLAGSSALAVATIEAVGELWGVELDPRVVAALALRAERDVLGIAVGWQDRIVQSYRSTVLVDAARTSRRQGLEVPGVVVLPAPRATAPGDGPDGPDGHRADGERIVGWLVVGWSADAGESSDAYHAPLRRAAADLAVPMARLGDLARAAADAWRRADLSAVGVAMSDGWRVRQSCAPLRADHAALVEAVRSTGVAATTPGSGGSVVALCPDATSRDRVLAVLASQRAASTGLVLVTRP